MRGAVPLGPTLVATIIASLTDDTLLRLGSGLTEAPPSRAAPDSVIVNRSITLQPGRLLVLYLALVPGSRDRPVGQHVLVTWGAAAQKNPEHSVVSCLLPRKLGSQPRQGMFYAIRSRERVIEPSHPAMQVCFGRLEIHKLREALEVVVRRAYLSTSPPIALQERSD